MVFSSFKKHCPEIFSAGLHFALELKMKNVPVTMGFHPKIYETQKVKKLRGLGVMIFEGIEDYMHKNVANLGKNNLETNKQTS